MQREILRYRQSVAELEEGGASGPRLFWNFLLYLFLINIFSLCILFVPPTPPPPKIFNRSEHLLQQSRFLHTLPSSLTQVTGSSPVVYFFFCFVFLLRKTQSISIFTFPSCSFHIRSQASRFRLHSDFPHSSSKQQPRCDTLVICSNSDESHRASLEPERLGPGFSASQHL